MFGKIVGRSCTCIFHLVKFYYKVSVTAFSTQRTNVKSTVCLAIKHQLKVHLS